MSESSFLPLDVGVTIPSPIVSQEMRVIQRHDLGGEVIVRPYPAALEDKAIVEGMGFTILEEIERAGMTLLTVFARKADMTTPWSFFRDISTMRFFIYHLTPGANVTPAGVQASKSDTKAHD
jgi:hypothetical protein